MLRSRRFEAHYLAKGLQMGDTDVFQIWQGRENGQGENLTRLEGSDWIYIKIGATQADVLENSLTLKGGVSIRPAAMILQRQGNLNPIKPSSFYGVDHDAPIEHL